MVIVIEMNLSVQGEGIAIDIDQSPGGLRKI